MSNAINQVIESTLRSQGHGQYITYAAGVAEALAEREFEIADDLIEAAVDKGLSRDEAVQVVTDAGLLVRPVEAPQVADGSDAGGVLAAIQTRLDTLTTFARRHGFTG